MQLCDVMACSLCVYVFVNAAMGHGSVYGHCVLMCAVG